MRKDGCYSSYYYSLIVDVTVGIDRGTVEKFSPGSYERLFAIGARKCWQCRFDEPIRVTSRPRNASTPTSLSNYVVLGASTPIAPYILVEHDSFRRPLDPNSIIHISPEMRSRFDLLAGSKDGETEEKQKKKRYWSCCCCYWDPFLF